MAPARSAGEGPGLNPPKPSHQTAPGSSERPAMPGAGQSLPNPQRARGHQRRVQQPCGEGSGSAAASRPCSRVAGRQPGSFVPGWSREAGLPAKKPPGMALPRRRCTKAQPQLQGRQWGARVRPPEPCQPAAPSAKRVQGEVGSSSRGMLRAGEPRGEAGGHLPAGRAPACPRLVVRPLAPARPRSRGRLVWQPAGSTGPAGQ